MDSARPSTGEKGGMTMETDDPNRDACWTAARGAAELTAMTCAATGQYGWAIAIKSLVLLADVLVARFRR
ncbi:hypothetical protein GCM10009687_29650 [Asanoa iriomotensis]